MKKIILLTIMLSLFMHLFACVPGKEGSDIDNTPINSTVDNVTQNPEGSFSGYGNEVPPNDDYDWSRQFIHFETFNDYADWYKSGKYLSDFYIDKDGKKFNNLLRLGKELQQGERCLYIPYYYGRIPNSRITVYLHKVNFNVSWAYILTPDETQKDTQKNKLFCDITLKYLNSEYRNTSDIISAYKSVSSDEPPVKIDDQKVRYDGLEREVLTTFSTFDSGPTIINKHFVWKDVMVTISHYDDLGFNLQDFLDGFELRPIDLTKEKIPIE